MFTTEKKYLNGVSFRSLELPGYFLDYIPGDLNNLVITFENADKPKLPRTNALREPWGAFHLLKKGYSILGVKPKAADWYRGRDLHEFFRSDEFNVFRLSFKQVFLYGSSMGGYAALTFAEACPNSIVIAYNPQTTLDPKEVPWEQRYEEGRSQDWTGDFSDARVGATKSKKNYIAYDNFFLPDRKHVQRLDSSNCIFLKLSLVEHIVSTWMREVGILQDFLTGALEDKLTNEQCSQLARNRRKTPRYFYGLGKKTKSENITFYCLQKILSFCDLNINHQNDFSELIRLKRAWILLSDPVAIKQISRFDDEVIFRILKALADDGDPLHSLSICNLIINQRDVSSSILMLSAECLFKLGRLEEAEHRAALAIIKNPSAGNNYRILGRILFSAGNFTGAREAAMTSVDLDSKSYIGWGELSKYCEQLAQYKMAANALLKALRLRPGDISFEKRLNRILDRLDQS